MTDTSPTGNLVTRALWLVAGLLAVGLGGLGIIIPGLPTTVFFIVAAWCFSKSSPRLERWVLGLPRIGPLVTDYRNGLGMARRAKVLAISMMLVAGGLSVWLAIDSLLLRAILVALLAIGVWVVGFHVPTRERVLEAQSD